MNTPEGIRIRPARAEDIAAIAEVHGAAFPGFFLTRIGTAFLRAYYRTVFEFDKGILLTANDGQELVGFVSGFGDPARFRRHMMARGLRFLYPTMCGLAKHPSLWRRVLYNTRRFGTDRATSADGACELASLGIDPARAGHGYGRDLVRAFLATAGSGGATLVGLTTDADGNDGVNAFYRKCGFTLERTFGSGKNRRMNEYRISLDRSDGGG